MNPVCLLAVSFVVSYTADTKNSVIFHNAIQYPVRIFVVTVVVSTGNTVPSILILSQLHTNSILFVSLLLLVW